MATVEVAIFTKLTTIPAATQALVAARIYPSLLPQDPTLPAITYQRITTGRVRSLSGLSGLAFPRLQLNCWATTPEGARAIAAAVRADLDNIGETVGGVTLKDGITEDEGDMIAGAGDMPGQRMFGVRVDMTIWHEES